MSSLAEGESLPPTGAAARRAGTRTPADARFDADLWVRSVLFVAALLLVWISVHPFTSLAGPTSYEGNEAGDALNQAAYLILAAGFAAFLMWNGANSLRALATPVFIATMLWLVLSVLLSHHAGLSARRFGLVTLVMMIAAGMPLLPRNVRHFSDLLAGSTLLVLALCYLGILLAPDLSIHQASDAAEPILEGNWRGLFSHKNTAGSMMAIFIFIGLFVARVRSLVIGGLIAALSAVFLMYSQSKTPIMMAPVVLVLAPVLMGIERAWLRVGLTLVVLGILTVFTIGSVFFDPIRAALDATMPDPTFTGRTFIWEFARDHLPGNLLKGYGFSAFWGSSEVVYGATEAPEFVSGLPSGHNSYLDLALTTGLPGLALVVLWAVLGPAANINRQIGNHEDYLLSLLFTRIWLFTVVTSGFETIFFQRDDPTWFTFLIAIFGLRYMTARRVVA
jgi:O-antigen ligase